MPTATWSSNNETVATVDSTGLVSALANGTATITAEVDGQIVAVDVEVDATEVFAFTIDTRLDTKTFIPIVVSNGLNAFSVDWGDGTALDARTNATRNNVHTYDTDGEYTIKIIGLTPSSMSFQNDKKLISVQSGFLENTASSMQSYFNGCTNLKTIPGNLFAKSTAVTDFRGTFYNCNSLTGSIPADLFKNNTLVTSFQSIFEGCSSLTGSIPAGLFDAAGANVTNFLCTFKDCSSLTGSIPADLFENNLSVTDFRGTFSGCSAITGDLPELWTSHLLATSYVDAFTGCILANNHLEAINKGWAQ